MPLDARCADLSAAHRQLLEIARIVAPDSRVIILGEPTASRSPGKTSRRDGRGMIFVSSRLEEIFAICDHITGLRDGETVAKGRAIDSLDQASLIRLMVGREMESLTARNIPDASAKPLALTLRGVASANCPRIVGAKASSRLFGAREHASKPPWLPDRTCPAL